MRGSGGPDYTASISDNPGSATSTNRSSDSFTSGTYVVGTDIVAGTYKTTVSTSSLPCYWARRKDTSGDFAAIIANGNPSGPTTVMISKSDGAFETSGCDTWKKIG